MTDIMNFSMKIKNDYEIIIRYKFLTIVQFICTFTFERKMIEIIELCMESKIRNS